MGGSGVWGCAGLPKCREHTGLVEGDHKANRSSTHAGTINDYDIAAYGVGEPVLTVPIPAVVVDPEILWQDVYNNG